MNFSPYSLFRSLLGLFDTPYSRLIHKDFNQGIAGKVAFAGRTRRYNYRHGIKPIKGRRA